MRVWYIILSLIREALKVYKREDFMSEVNYIIWKELE